MYLSIPITCCFCLKSNLSFSELMCLFSTCQQESNHLYIMNTLHMGEWESVRVKLMGEWESVRVKLMGEWESVRTK